MHIHAKLIAGLLILLAGIAASVTLTIHLYLLPHVQVIETRNLNTDLDRIDQGFAQELQRLTSLANDWGQWDDTYAYMASHNQEYVKSNLTPSLLATVNADLFAIITPEGQVLQLMTTESTQQVQHLEGQFLTGDHPLRLVGKVEELRGLFNTSGGPMLFAASPILPSEGMDNERGLLLFGRSVDNRFQSYLANVTRLPLTLSTTQTALHAAAILFPSDNEALAKQTQAFANDPASHLLLSIQKDRPYYQEASAVVDYTLLIIAVLGSVVSLLAYLFLKSTIVKPILTLKSQAESFGKERNLLGFKPLSQNDELGELSLSFINMARQLAESQGALEQERQRYMDASLTDPLTQLRNRRFMDLYFTESRALQTPEPVLIMMIDLDHFKQVNDTYGHDAGDQVLRELSILLQQASRDSDLVVRYGGEEFMLVCRNTDEETACAIAERIRAQVEGHNFCANSTPVQLTCSIGFFTCLASTTATAVDWYAMTKVADLALYAAKHSGRNTWIGLKTENCQHRGLLPTRSDEVQHSLDNRALTSFCACGDCSRIQWF